MFSELIIKFMVFWGIWIFIPVLLDGSIAFRRINFSWRMLIRRKANQKTEKTPMAYYPPVSLIIPIHNSEDTLERCLHSLVSQTYPLNRIEAFLIDNGSTDGSFQVYSSFVNRNPSLTLKWVRIEEAGKAKALNSGIFLGNSEIVINVDSDTRLDPEVIEQTVRELWQNPGIAGATAAIMIDFRLISQESGFLRMLQSCEVIEYLQSFYIGRRYESHRNTLFTLAGAFSCFRRQDLLGTFLYDQNSISEDTKMTFELRRKHKDKKIVFLENVRVYVEPITSLAKLYAQRVRWQRGELDVIGSYMEFYKGGIINLLRSFAARLLFIDHTMIFPRVVWTFLLPFLLLFGYPLSLIVLANLIVYGVYLIIDLNYLLIAYFYVDAGYRKYLRDNWWRVIFLPFYRFVVFWFRAASAIHAVTDTAQWTVKNPVAQSKEAAKGMINKLKAR